MRDCCRASDNDERHLVPGQRIQQGLEIGHRGRDRNSLPARRNSSANLARARLSESVFDAQLEILPDERAIQILLVRLYDRIDLRHRLVALAHVFGLGAIFSEGTTGRPRPSVGAWTSLPLCRP
jgi:hypothetical protein